jgi:hypothetical protein
MTKLNVNGEKMDEKNNNRSLKAPKLQAIILEPILQTYVSEATIIDLLRYTKSITIARLYSKEVFVLSKSN